MELVLIRHALAEDAGADKPDAERRLTRAGRRRFEAALPALSVLIEKKQVRIWTSPLARARETAEILAKCLGTDSVEPVDAVAGGSFEAFFELLAHAAPDDCIVVVGHQPQLGLWSRQICGFELPFKKGAAAAFQLEPPSGPAGELRWFIQPGPLRRLGRA